jgi:uncharacterized membrane protein YhaH (DUF805 family)
VLFGRAGRIDRPTYWAALVFACCVFLAAAPWLAVVGKTGDTHLGSPVFVLAAIGVAPWMVACVLVKRWHDLDKSGWWALTGIAPVLGWIAPGVMDGTSGPNRFGADARPALSPRRGIVAGAALAVLLLVFYEGVHFYAQEPSRSELASGAPVSLTRVAPTVTTDLPGHFVSVVRPYAQTLISAGAAMRDTASLPRSEFFAQLDRMSIATRTLSLGALQLKADPATEADIRTLVIANNNVLALIPQIEIETTSSKLVQFEEAFLPAVAATVRVENDLGITQQQLEGSSAPAE